MSRSLLSVLFLHFVPLEKKYSLSILISRKELKTSAEWKAVGITNGRNSDEVMIVEKKLKKFCRRN